MRPDLERSCLAAYVLFVGPVVVAAALLNHRRARLISLPNRPLLSLLRSFDVATRLKARTPPHGVLDREELEGGGTHTCRPKWGAVWWVICLRAHKLQKEWQHTGHRWSCTSTMYDHFSLNDPAHIFCPVLRRAIASLGAFRPTRPWLRRPHTYSSTWSRVRRAMPAELPRANHLGRDLAGSSCGARAGYQRMPKRRSASPIASTCHDLSPRPLRPLSPSDHSSPLATSCCRLAIATRVTV